MKKGIAILASLVLFGTMTGCSKTGEDTAKQSGRFTPGSYSASATGYAGQITVEVTCDEESITQIVIQEDSESADIGEPAMAQIIDEITKNQSIAVDTISGATYSSEALLTAVANCVTQAGVNPENFK